MNEPLFHPTQKPFPGNDLPEVIIESEPDFAELWHLAWKLGWEHVYESDQLPYSPYLSEGCGVNRIWIWDSCFMALWGCYAPDIFPVCNTLDNFYAVMNGKSAGIKVHHPDNPPLFGWAELELYRHTGNRDRIVKLVESKVLQNYYRWREEKALPGDFLPWGAMPVLFRCLKNGCLWSGDPSGMDNTPRGRGKYYYLLWVDALAQEGLFAKDIASLCKIAGDDEQAKMFLDEFEKKKLLMQEYFDPEDGCFYDRHLARTGKDGFSKVLTPASFWPVFAGMANREQTRAMVEKLLDPDKLGGPVACPSVSRDDPDFDPRGCYWRGGVWLPVFFMTMKALDQAGENDLARKLSVQLLKWMKTCCDRVEPHTIWECYSPTEPMPANNKQDKLVRKDFCGWSALGPISLLIEDIIGIHGFDPEKCSLTWDPGLPEGRLGIRGLNFCGGKIDLVRENDQLHICSTIPLTVYFQKRKLVCKTGGSIFSIK